MACNDIIYNGKKYSEEEFVDLLNSGTIKELSTKPLTDDLQQPHHEDFSSIQDFTERYRAISDRKQELQQQGAQISNLGEKGFNWVMPGKKSDVFYQLAGADEKANIVKTTMKSVEVAQTPQSIVNWSKLLKGSITFDQFLNNSQFPKEQKSLLQDIWTTEHPKTLGDLITSMVVKYSYTVEINTAKDKSVLSDMRYEGSLPNTNHYSNMTVPGGTNYTENEIATPGIVPSIKGHAQFSTDNGIGWFRSDDRGNSFKDVPNKGTGRDTISYNEKSGMWDVINDSIGPIDHFSSEKEAYQFLGIEHKDYTNQPKTRRILEVQSDLFQKGRDKEFLTETNKYDDSGAAFEDKKGINSNQFLQLLNKDGNWIPFFIKSIVQDSAKKGYEKVLFPTGDTASKVEGHETLEQFKKQKEDRIKYLETYDDAAINKKYKPVYNAKLENPYISTSGKSFKTSQEAIDYERQKDLKEIKQIQEELKRVETEGFAALKPIYNFYETRIGNTLSKIYGKDKVERIKDEHGNEWYQIGTESSRDKRSILYQKSDTEGSHMSDISVDKWKQWFSDNSVDYSKVTDGIRDNQGNIVPANEVVDVVNRVVQVAEGKENVAIGEAGMHIVTRIIKESNPKLYKEMASRIGSYNLYTDTLAAYGKLKEYRTADDKPDILKIKEETIGKLLNELYIKDQEGSTEKSQLLTQAVGWWQRILQHLRDFFTGNPWSTKQRKLQEDNELPFKEVIEKFKTGELRPDKLTREQRTNQLKYKKHGLQDIIRGDVESPGTGKISAASLYLRNGKEAGQRSIPWGRPTKEPGKREDESRLRDYITKNDLWYTKPIETGTHLESGQESSVYYNSDSNTVTKTNNIKFYGNWKDYLDNLSVHNKYFPKTAYKLEGFVEKDDKLQVVVSQDFIGGKKLNDKNKLYDFLGANGWRQLEPMDQLTNNYYNEVLGIQLYDLHTGNVLITPNGALQFIDTQFYLTKDFYKSVELPKSDIFYQLDHPEEDKGLKLFNLFKNQKGIRKSTNDKGDSIYLVDNGLGKEVEPEHRVTDFAKKVYEKAFGKKGVQGRNEKQEKTDKETGTRLHGYMEDIIKRNIDSDTGLRKELDTHIGAIVPGEEGIYDNLDKYIGIVMDRYPEGTRFLPEQVVYKPGGKQAGKEDIAGTLDFIAIKPNGEVSNLDWKFMNEKIAKTSTADISNITQKAHNVQMSYYGTILKTGYGIKSITESNTVPFIMKYGEHDEQYTLKNVIIGDPDYTKINDRVLLPVTSNQVEIPGDTRTTALIGKLNKLRDRIYNETVPASERIEHEKQLQDLNYAIRKLVAGKSVWETANVAFSMVKSYIADLNEVQHFIDNKVVGDRTSSEDAGRLLDKLNYAIQGLNIFRDLSVNLKDFLAIMDPAEKDQLDKLLTRIDKNIDDASKQLYDESTNLGLLQKGGIKIAEDVDIWNLISLDKEMNMLQRNFNTLSASTIKSAQVLYKYATKARGRYEMMAADMAHELKTIDEKVTQWMGGAWDNKKLLDTIAKKDKNGNYKPYLINKVSDKFYEGLDKAQDAKDSKWILDNIDTKAYREDYKKELDSFIERANSKPFDALSYEEDPGKRAGTLDQELREKHIQWFMDTFDIDGGNSNAFSYRNNKLKYYTTDANWSDGYKNLVKSENKPVKELYDHIVDLNKRAHESGMLGDYYVHFLPQMMKRTKESLLAGNFKGAGRSLVSKFVTEEGERRYRDPLSNEVVNSVRGKYTYDLGTDDDYSMVSEDIMKSLTLYAKEIAAHEELSKIEGIAKTLVAIESEKKTRAYEKGKMLLDESGRPIPAENKYNVQYLKNEVNRIMYGEKRADDPGITITINGEDLHLSAGKTIDTLVQAFTLKGLGLNPQSAFSNLFGGTANAYLSTGRHITKGELSQAYYDVLQAKFYTEEGKKFIALLDHFVPFTEEVSRHLGKHASKQKVLNWLSGEGLMVLMRKSENIVQMANASAYFRNTMVENGKLVNIREFVRNKYDYDNIYKKSESERKVINDLINKEVKELQGTRNLFNDKSIKFDTKTFKVDMGVARYSDSELDLREKIQQLTRDCLGNRTPDEMAQINTFLLGGALMNFKNWIPGLAQKRFGDFKYHSGQGTYEIGRARMLADVMTEHAHTVVGKTLAFLYGTATKGIAYAHFGYGTEGIVESARRQYQRRLAQASTIEGTEDTMFSKTVSEAEFIDQYLHGVKAQVKELEAVVALMSAFYAALACAQSIQKEDDNYAQRGAAKWTVRMMDKFSDELGFFYSPTSAGRMIGAGGTIIPMVSTVVDLQKFLTHLTKEGYYLATGDDDAESKNKVLKYPINYIPAVNQLSSYFGMFNEDWGKTMGYNPSYRYSAGFSK